MKKKNTARVRSTVCICRVCNLRHNHSTMGFWWSKKENSKVETSNVSNCFLKNGSMFLQQLIADCNGISNPIRMFTSDQISKVNDHFDPNSSIVEDTDTYFTWYKGEIEGRPCAIKRYTERLYVEEEMAYNDIVLSARVSNHSGFLKLIGCCLEYPLPVLVFEDLDCRVLNHRGTVGAPLLPWNVRLKIAKEVAIAVTYLHTAFPRIIIHRNIKTTNVFLDKNGTAKLTDLSHAVTLPEGKSWIEEPVLGTYGYLDPNYYTTSLVTEYTDVVFSFGILMLVLLMGRPPFLDEPDGSSVHDRRFIG
ncbi:non-functional pseudokinase ZED1-like isoform X2 [Brassica rapa]|uniref:non-functional pseudokinase ZED1-like isoform X2 n=1 Tax=Brassica campestris TaxID=3711 RepID=UPI00142E1E2F|nr:non-functional pseudokinase ZED1-like isoform X2 [Brassica rapa]